MPTGDGDPAEDHLEDLGSRPSCKSSFAASLGKSDWGAPRVHGELLLLGFDVAERTISRYLRARPSRPDAVQSWKRFL